MTGIGSAKSKMPHFKNRKKMYSHATWGVRGHGGRGGRQGSHECMWEVKGWAGAHQPLLPRHTHHISEPEHRAPLPTETQQPTQNHLRKAPIAICRSGPPGQASSTGARTTTQHQQHFLWSPPLFTAGASSTLASTVVVPTLRTEERRAEKTRLLIQTRSDGIHTHVGTHPRDTTKILRCGVVGKGGGQGNGRIHGWAHGRTYDDAMRDRASRTNAFSTFSDVFALVSRKGMDNSEASACWPRAGVQGRRGGERDREVCSWRREEVKSWRRSQQ